METPTPDTGKALPSIGSLVSSIVPGGSTPYAPEDTETRPFATPSSPMSIITMATICTNVSCKQAVLHLNETMTPGEDMTGKDASWILTSAVIIFTMQTGFGLLEAGAVSPKNEINIMVKNTLDVVFGGITYWAIGFGLSFGEGDGTNPFVGVGCFLFDSTDTENMGYSYALFLFQLSFSTTATTIVSGAMAERTKLSAYIIFSLLNTLIYCIPAHWIWAESGFLFKMGAIDVAGCGPVHLVGGASGLVATLMLKPRQTCAFDKPREPLPAPLKSILGMFMLWWGWLRFNSGSVFIISDSSEWRLAVRAAVNTIVASMGGGIFAVILSVVIGHCCNNTRYDIGIMINGVLGSLVSITSICTLCRPWEAIVIGCVGALISVVSGILLYKTKVDDPVGVIPVHGCCAVWGLLSVGLFVEPDYSTISGQAGLFKTGQWYMLGIQSLTAVLTLAWTIFWTYIFLKVIDRTIGLRLSNDEELMGADILEHGINNIFGGIAINKKESKDAVENMMLQNETHAEFRKKLMQFFSEMAAVSDKNDLMLTVSTTTATSVSFELKLLEKAPSVDSGVEIHI